MSPLFLVDLYSMSFKLRFQLCFSFALKLLHDFKKNVIERKNFFKLKVDTKIA